MNGFDLKTLYEAPVIVLTARNGNGHDLGNSVTCRDCSRLLMQTWPPETAYFTTALTLAHPMDPVVLDSFADMD